MTKKRGITFLVFFFGVAYIRSCQSVVYRIIVCEAACLSPCNRNFFRKECGEN